MRTIRKFFTEQCPLDAVSLTGKMSDNFFKGQPIILVHRETREWRLKLVQRVVNCGDGNCTLDLTW